MGWTLVGKLVLRSAPKILELIENGLNRPNPPGIQKREAALSMLHDELHYYSPQLANDARVLAVLTEVNESLVKAHNVIALVENELNTKGTDNQQ